MPSSSETPLIQDHAPRHSVARRRIVQVIALVVAVTGGYSAGHAQPATVTLSYDGKLRDKVGQGNTAMTADGQLDGIFTLTLNAGSGPRTVTALDLRNSKGGIWDTQPATLYWALGVAPSLDAGLYQSNNDPSVSLVLAEGGTASLFASDTTNFEFEVGTVFTVTVTFADGTSATAATTVGLWADQSIGFVLASIGAGARCQPAATPGR
jgi:hypothetical protein